jgi:hypothetical protein
LGTGKSQLQVATEKERHYHRRHEYTKKRENIKEHNTKKEIT